jgi:hypothetical protein
MKVAVEARRMLLTLLAFFAIAAVASACRDGGGVTGTDPEGGARFSEGYELDTLEVTACGPGTHGEDPNCEPDVSDDPCVQNPSSPGCGADDYCTIDPSLPGCSQDPCTVDPTSCNGGGEPYEPTSGEPSATAPAGVSQDEYNKLNRAEKLLCLQNSFACGYVIGAGHRASSWARSQTPELGNAEGDNKRDALRHTVWQAQLAWFFNSSTAETWGDAHETGSTSGDATCMDQHNNAVGRGIGASASGIADIEQKVLNAWNNGQLQGSPGC